VLRKLLSFIFRTRFSRPFLILIVVMLIYAAVITSVTPPNSMSVVLSYYATAIIAFFLAMALATGGVMVMKSDRDYLFTLPLSPRDLAIAIFFAQFVAFGTTVLLMFAYLAQALYSAVLFVNLAALALVFTSLGVIAPSLQTRPRIVISVALALWTLSAFLNFPFSPGSAFSGNLWGGTATNLVFAAVTVPLAFRGLSRIELDMMKSMVRNTASDIKSPNSYVGKSPLGAIYSMNITNMAIAGRMNMAGTSRYVSRRVKTRWVLIASTVAAAAYFAFALYTGSRVEAVNGADVFPGAIIVAIVLSFLAFFFSQSAITNERIWLSLTSLPPATYFRHLIASKLISLMIILVPFAIADAVLAAYGYAMSMAGLVIILTVIPASFVLQICFAAYVAPIQVKGDDMMMPAQFNLRQMATGLLVVPTFFLAAVGSIFPTVAAVGGLFLCAVAGLLVYSGGFWSRVVTRLTESGFV
jgi:hypothetical protein